MKTCSKCKTPKVLEAFHADRGEKDGRQPWCIACRKKHARLHPEHRRAAVKRWQKANPEKVKEYRRERTLAVYGLTPHSFAKMLHDQSYKCLICREQIGSRAHIDHDHTFTFVRGLLCSQCNVGLGMFKESKKILSDAIQYLTDNETRRILPK